MSKLSGGVLASFILLLNFLFVSFPSPASATSFNYLTPYASSSVQVETISLNMENTVGGLYTTAPEPLWDFIMPLKAGIPTSPFGFRDETPHNGLDFAEHWGAFVYAVQSGVITQAGVLNGYGNTVEIDHGNGVKTLYAHLSSFPVSVGDRVIQGQIIGTIGNTGFSKGPHLHIEVRVNDVPKDPSHYLPFG